MILCASDQFSIDARFTLIFSNTTPFIALSSIGQLDLLPCLFGRIHVVPHVVFECAVGGLINVPPLASLEWVQIATVDERIDPMPLLAALDVGEKWTIHAALAVGTSTPARVLIDERIARMVAERLGLKVSGTLGVLLLAKERGLISSFRDTATRMRAHGIFYNEALVHRLAQSINE